METLFGIVVALGLVAALAVQVVVLLRLPPERSGDRSGPLRRLLPALVVAAVLIAVGAAGWLLG